ncbi:MAG: NAD+ synthase, partial [Thermodesulfobacteriota bacterium]|nr:NAD+ synthase [Thermodesulfobacteriota bacterium]
MKFALLQLNMTVGDFESNGARILAAVKSAKQRGAKFCVTSEMALTGYPSRDLLLDKSFIEKSRARLQGLAQDLEGSLPVLVGTVDRNESGMGKPLFNAAILLHEGEIKDRFHKTLLPTYDVFDEARYFEPGSGPGFLEFAGVSIAVTICEDLWNDTAFWKERRYANDPLEKISAKGADVIVNLSSSPFTIGKQQIRQEMLSSIAGKYKTWVLYANQVGGNDDLVFPGRSMAFDPSGKLIARGKAFEEDVVLVDTDFGFGEILSDDFSPESEAWRALLLGTRDYVQKCGFKKALVGLSGGIDSSLTAAVAAKALGSNNVLGVLMPSPYSSAGSVNHSLELAENMGIRTMRLPIEEIMDVYGKTLEPAFEGYPPDVTEENIQARIRGNLLMALSNKYGAMLLTTGNKSESAVGYCTLYGD